MNSRLTLPRQHRRGTLAVLASATLLLTGCETLGPLGVIATKFAQNVLFAAAQNHTPQYASDVQQLLTALVFEKGRNGQYSGAAYQPIGNTLLPQGQEAYGYQQAGYPQQYQEPYAQQQGGYQQQAYPPQAAPQQDAAYRHAGHSPPTSGQEPIALDASILVQRAGHVGTEPFVVNDGDTLFDGKGDPKAGDKIKISFRTNCDCHVYVVGIDATGYAVPIFPDPQSGLTNPVSTNNALLVPEGTFWYGLDDYRGVEQIYFVASYTPRPDLDDILERLKKHERRPLTDYQPVTQAAIVPQTRGLVKIRVGAPVSVKTENGRSFEVNPTGFLSAADSSDIVVTRWFNHQ